MPPPARDLPTAPDQPVKTGLFTKGRRIIVSSSAGPRLAGKNGTVIGKGTTPNQVRVLLDGSKSYITLHARFVEAQD